MKIQQSQSRDMKYQALKWLRLDQRCMFIATEVGQYNADVLGINEKKIVEIEVKISMTDFKNDFKKPKHEQYSKAGYFTEAWYKAWVPTHFYFAVLDEMVEPVKEFLDKHKGELTNAYGVINAKDWSVVRRAKWLHKDPPSNRVKCTTALRMGSELIRFHEAWL